MYCLTLSRFNGFFNKTIARFLKGFIDSEGSVDKDGSIHVCNTDLKLLDYVKELHHKEEGGEATKNIPAPRSSYTYFHNIHLLVVINTIFVTSYFKSMSPWLELPFLG